MTASFTDVAATIRNLASLRSRLDCSDDALMEMYWRFHPRFRFVKTSPWRASLLDLGAGSGGLAQWGRWGAPVRDDIAFYGVDINLGEHSKHYRAWETLDLDAARPEFRGVTFDACVLSHVIEHVRDPARVLGWIGEHSRPGTLLYCEWPGMASLHQPSRDALLAYGIDIMITNFFDDASHVGPVSQADLIGWLAAAGFSVVEAGTIDLGLIGEEMLVRGLKDGDGFKKLCGFWSTTRWAEWLIACFH